MLNEFFCWLTGHKSFTAAEGIKLYRVLSAGTFICSGIRMYQCKCCKKLFTRWDNKYGCEVDLSAPVDGEDVPPMPGRSGLTG